MLDDADEERKNILLICYLVGFLICQISRDEVEWDTWGREFVSNIFSIQFGEEKVNLLECHTFIALNFINFRGMNIFATLKKIAFGTLGLITKIR